MPRSMGKNIDSRDGQLVLQLQSSLNGDGSIGHVKGNGHSRRTENMQPIDLCSNSSNPYHTSIAATLPKHLSPQIYLTTTVATPKNMTFHPFIASQNSTNKKAFNKNSERKTATVDRY